MRLKYPTLDLLTLINPMELHQRIKTLRQERGWKQQELAEKVGIKQKQISTYETGTSVPPTDVLIRLAEAFGVSLDYLAFEAQGQSATVNVKDRDLLKRFEILDGYEERERGVVKEILDLIITKQNIKVAVGT